MRCLHIFLISFVLAYTPCVLNANEIKKDVYYKILDTINEKIASYPEKYGYPSNSYVDGYCLIDKTNHAASVRIFNIIGYRSETMDELVTMAYRYNVYYIIKSKVVPVVKIHDVARYSNSFLIRFPIDIDRRWKPRYFPSPSKGEIENWKKKLSKTIFDYITTQPNLQNQFGRKVKLNISMNQNEDMVCNNINLHIMVYGNNNKIFYCTFSPRNDLPYFDDSAQYYVSSFNSNGFPTKYGVPFSYNYKEFYIEKK